MSRESHHLEALQDIRRMMQRSSKFLSLSGLSGIAAGFWALIGAYVAYDWIDAYHRQNYESVYSGTAFQNLTYRLLFLAAAVLTAALTSAFFFTWRRATQSRQPLWDHTTRMLAVSLLIPLVTGGLLILALLRYNEWRFVAPLCLIFYGLALVNGSKYTLSDIRYLGLIQIVLGLIATQFIGYGLHFWGFGFGVLHMIYGFVMWWRNERHPEGITA